MTNLIYSGSSPDGKSVKVRWRKEWREHVVQFFEGEEYLSKADYFTPDRDDAMATAREWLGRVGTDYDDKGNWTGNVKNENGWTP
jgi:hypothetical protein